MLGSRFSVVVGSTPQIRCALAGVAAFAWFALGWIGPGPTAQAVAEEPMLLVRPNAFRTLVNPNCSHCVDEAKARAGELRADDPVLAWTRGKYDGGAIPIRFFLNPYRVISDTYGVFVFDPDAGFARGYEPSLDFTFYGWRNGIVVMQHKDGTLFSALSGRAFDGPRKGERLVPVATLPSHWGHWQKAYPGSVAYRMFEKYQPTELPDRDNTDSTRTRGVLDPRLAATAEVLGVSIGDDQKAYPLSRFPRGGGVVHDQLAGREIAVLWFAATRTAVAYLAQLDDDESTPVKQLEFDAANPAAPFIDRATNSRFGIEGRAISGPFAGKTLTWLDSVQCRWFAWSAEYPGTEVQDGALPAEGGGKTGATRRETKARQMVLVAPDAVTRPQMDAWRGEGFDSLVVVLDERYTAAAYRDAASVASEAEMELRYWIEIARNPRMADAHPRWMAALGMHEDWSARFPDVKTPGKGEVAKAYPWVPIGYAESFQAHLTRVRRLLDRVPGWYRGLILNDLQGGPASCGCGNLQCRWAIDYHVAATATSDRVDDAAARFVAEVRELAPGKEVVPVWMTECEESDLVPDQAPDRNSTGLCGSVPCAHGTCPRAFAKQLRALLAAHAGPLGLFAAQQASGRDATFYGPAGWVASSVAYLDGTLLSPKERGVPRERLWLVVQGTAGADGSEPAAREAARASEPGAIIVARVPLEQSYEPRVIPAY